MKIRIKKYKKGKPLCKTQHIKKYYCNKNVSICIKNQKHIYIQYVANFNSEIPLYTVQRMRHVKLD